MSDEQSPETHGHHPVAAVEHEVEHLHDVAAVGESGATPAILAGGVIAVLLPLAVVLIGLGFLFYYVVGRS